MHKRDEAASLAGRAALALALMIGFYALALGIAVALLSIPYLEWVSFDRVHLKVAFICIVAAGTILWAVVPRPDRFEPPGPALTREEHPRLFEAIDRVARATNQALPAEVYLLNDMNAFVAQRGGLMGIGSRRVMALGLPLLQALNVSQLEAVLAHEFGHFHGGDVKLGPWIYKTRAAIERTVMALVARGGEILHRPFVWYGRLFLRITHALSRRQEHAADALAAHVVGAGPLAEGLKITHGGALGFELYFREDLVPALEAGFRPPLLQGFTRFLQAPRAREVMNRAVDVALTEQEHDPFDTHPPLPLRLAALAGLPAWAPGRVPDERPAVSLLDHLPQLEEQLLIVMATDPAKVRALVPVAWEEIGDRVYAGLWRENVADARSHLSGLKAGELPADQAFYSQLGRRLSDGDTADVPEERLARFAASHLASCLAVHLVQSGWRVKSLPGEPVELQSQGQTWEVFTRLADLTRGALSAEDWRADCARADVLGLDLGAVATPHPEAAPASA